MKGGFGQRRNQRVVIARNHIPLFSDDAVGRQPENVEAPVAHEAKVGRGCDRDARIEEGAVLDRVAVEALGPELEHGGGGGSGGATKERIEAGKRQRQIHANRLGGVERVQDTARHCALRSEAGIAVVHAWAADDDACAMAEAQAE